MTVTKKGSAILHRLKIILKEQKEIDNPPCYIVYY